VPGIDECLAEAMAIPGVLGASLVDWSSGLVLGTAGEGPNDDHEVAAVETTEVVRAVLDGASFTAAQTGKVPVEDIIISASAGYHLMRFIDTSFESSVFLYLWLDRGEANLAVARFRLQTLADRLVLV
jgi:hypothetical protein